MKIKVFFFICLLLGIATTQLSAQNNGDDHKTTKDLRVWIDYQFQNCVGELVTLTGTLDFIGNMHPYGLGGYRYLFRLRGEVRSSDGEVFKILQHEFNDDEGGNYHFNLIGDQGSHYIGSVIFVGWSPVVTKIICLENGKK